MRALNFKNKKISLEDIPVPVPAQGESLLRVTLAGICNTDLEITKGYFDYEGVMGHEFVGVVEQSDDAGLVGRRVVCDINCACHVCATCLAGNPHHCPTRTVIGIVKKNGAFSEYITVPTRNLVVVPDHCPDQMAVFAEPVAAALQIQEQTRFSPNEAICVLGDGKLGLLIAMTLSHAGHDVTLVGHHPERLSRMGENTTNYTLRALGQIFSTVIEATGSPEGFKTAQQIVLPKGRIILKSTYAQGFDFNPSMLVVNEVEIIGSRCGPMDKAVSLLASDSFDPSTLIDKSYPLSQGVEAMQQAAKKGVLKVLLDPSL